MTTLDWVGVLVAWCALSCATGIAVGYPVSK
jgi:hypothetical protein